MRVGINTLFMIPGEVGGTETYLRETLAAMVRRFPELELVLFATKDNAVVFQELLAAPTRGSIHELGFRAANRPARILREQLELPRRVRKAGVDVLWSPGYTAPFAAPCPQVVTIHDMQYKTHPEDLSFSARAVTDVLVRMAAARCRAVVADSAFSREEIVRFTSARPEQVTVVPLGVSPDFARDAGRAEPDGTPPAPTRRPYLLCVANTYPHKNVALLVEAFRLLASKIPHDLVLVGKPRRGESAVQQALAQVEDPSRVIRHDYVDRAHLIRLYRGADVLVFPSLYEGFGLPVLEAMCCEVPVVTTRNGAIPEVGGETVVYSDGRSAEDLAARVGEVVSWDPDTRRRQVQRARERAQGFTWERTAEVLVGLFRTVAFG